MAKVLVLIPPPVEPGEAPIHIRKITTIIVGVLSNEVSTELKTSGSGGYRTKKCRDYFTPKTVFSQGVIVFENIN